MTPYFRLAGRHHYAWSGLVLFVASFILAHGIIPEELTFLSYWREKAGIVGITLKPENIKTRAFRSNASDKICSQIMEDIS